MVIKPKFDDVREFNDGVAVVRVGEQPMWKEGYIDKTGKFIWGPK
jgi:hypothetical protein